MTISFEIPEDIEEADGLVFLKLGCEADQRRSRACLAPQSSLPILLYPPKPGDDCQRGRKRRPAPATSVPYWGFICALRIPRSRRTLPADKAVSETHVT